MWISNLLLVTFLGLISISGAATIPSGTKSLNRVSSTSPFSMLGSVQPVNPQQHPDWLGDFASSDCEHAFQNMTEQFAHDDLDATHLFWSRKWRLSPPRGPRPIELPLGTRFGTCILLFRIGKDFGDHVLPTWGGFHQTSQYPPWTAASLNDLLHSARYILIEVENLDRPAWYYGAHHGGSYVTIMYLPRRSFMARRWASDYVSAEAGPIRGILGSTNGTLSDAVAAGTTLTGVNTS
ncbi:hypothetical protein G7Y79_00004g012510 [Physcia stellaris]|nr:hypothetical protein G7Y79_00004g012510 [Physcia stellaris]